MANSKKDENGRNTMTALSNVDLSIVQIKANPSNNNGLKVDDNTTGSDIGNNSGIAQIDENNVSTLTALSSNGDGTIINLYADPTTGKLLIDSN